MNVAPSAGVLALGVGRRRLYHAPRQLLPRGMMFSRYRRAMTDDERAMLESERDEQLHRLRPSDIRLWAALLTAVACAVLAPWLGPLFWVLAAVFLLVGLPGAYLAYSGRRLARTLDAETAEMLAAGVVDARQVEAQAVAKIENIGNFAAWIFDVGGNQLYLHPVHIVPEGDEDPWPSTTFEMVSTTDGDALVLKTDGVMLEPQRVIDALDVDPRDLPWLEAFPGTLMSLEDDLRRWADAHPHEEAGKVTR